MQAWKLVIITNAVESTPLLKVHHGVCNIRTKLVIITNAVESTPLLNVHHGVCNICTNHRTKAALHKEVHIYLPSSHTPFWRVVVHQMMELHLQQGKEA